MRTLGAEVSPQWNTDSWADADYLGELLVPPIQGRAASGHRSPVFRRRLVFARLQVALERLRVRAAPLDMDLAHLAARIDLEVGGHVGKRGASRLGGGRLDRAADQLRGDELPRLLLRARVAGTGGREQDGREDEAAHRAVVARIRASGKETGCKKTKGASPFRERASIRALLLAPRRRSKSVPPPYRRRLGRLFEVGQVPAEEVARALLHLPDALAREAPLLAEVLQRPRIVLRQAVAQDVPRQLAHPLAHPPQGVAHVLLPLGADDLLVRRRAVVAQAVEVCRLALWIEGLLQRDVPG